MPYNLITILGPTATGKTKLAVRLAYEFNGEIISADSRQVYRKMDIGTGKDLNEYNINGKQIVYHLINIIDPGEEYNLFLFKKNFHSSFNEIIKKNKLPFLVGGTGMYLSSVLQNYKLKAADFEKQNFEELNSKSIEELRSILLKLNSRLHNTTDLLDKERIIKAIIISQSKNESKIEFDNISPFIIGIKPERDEIKKRITERLQHRLQNGMIDEVKKLVEDGISFEKLNYFGLEYRYIGLYLQGKINYNDMFQKLNSAIHDFAKRQMTWFKKMEREGVNINWIDGADFEKAKEILKS